MAKRHREVLAKLDPVAVIRYQITEKDIRMRFRKLQQLVTDNEWQDHGYAYEREDGRCSFRYNSLVWESTGSRLSARLYESGTRLDEVHTIIPTGERLRWLDIEEIEGDPQEIKARLDEACNLPQPQPVSSVKSLVA